MFYVLGWKSVPRLGGSGRQHSDMDNISEFTQGPISGVKNPYIESPSLFWYNKYKSTARGGVAKSFIDLLDIIWTYDPIKMGQLEEPEETKETKKTKRTAASEKIKKAKPKKKKQKVDAYQINLLGEKVNVKK